jgi:superfamily II DNA or RNA helicase
MLINDQLLTLIFDTNTLQRGKRYFSQGRVQQLAMDIEGMSIQVLRANVVGNRPQAYRTEVRFDRYTPSKINTYCTCPVGVHCKHAVAVIHQANYNETLASSTTDSKSPKAATEHNAETWLEQATSATSYPARPQSPECLVYLLRPQINGGRLSVAVHKVRQRKNGGYSKGSYSAVWNQSNLENNRPRYVQDSDLAPLTWLQALPASYRVEPILQGKIGGYFLEAALQTGRLFLESTANPPLQAGDGIEAGYEWLPLPGSRHWQLVPEALPEHVMLVNTEPPTYLDAHSHRLGPVHTSLNAETRALLNQCPPLSEAQLQEALPELSRLIEQTGATLPDAFQAPTIIEADPQPILQLYCIEPSKPGAVPILLARLRFAYHGHAVNYADPQARVLLQTPTGPILVIRDEDREADLRDQGLPGFQFTSTLASNSEDATMNALPESALVDFTLPTRNHWLDFTAYQLPQLHAQGWQIEMDESFDLPVVEVDQLQGSLRPDYEAPGWFDVELGIDLDGTTVDLIPLLHQALAYLPAYIEGEGADTNNLPDTLWLHNGETLIRVPFERIRPLAHTLLSLLGRESNDTLKLSRLDAAQLMGHIRADWDSHSELKALSEKLTNFQALDDIQPPEALNAQLRPYQQEGLNWLHFLREFGLGGILADDMGLGKTLQTLACIQSEKTAGRLNAPALVVCPTTLITNWQAEAEKFTPDLKVLVIHGHRRKPLFEQASKADVVITSYPLISRDIERHTEQTYSLAFFDEAQYLKNPATALAKAARKLPAETIIALTGTPMENHLGELWALFDLILPGYLGNRKAFQEHYRKPIEELGDPSRQAELSRRVRPFMLRRTKDQVTPELPEKTEIIRHVELNREQRDLYETVRASMDSRIREVLSEKGVGRSQIEILGALLKLRQICCHPALLNKDEKARSAKLDELLSMITELLEEGRRIVLFSQFTSMLALIEQSLKAAGIHYEKLTGQTRNRAKPVERFQNGESPVFLISLKAGGTGLNLTAADCVIHYDPWWNPAVEQQATDRAWRIGQDKPVFVYRLITEGTVEERMHALQARKSQLADGLYGSKDTFASALTAEDISVLFEKS